MLGGSTVNPFDSFLHQKNKWSRKSIKIDATHSFKSSPINVVNKYCLGYSRRNLLSDSKLFGGQMSPFSNKSAL